MEDIFSQFMWFDGVPPTFTFGFKHDASRDKKRREDTVTPIEVTLEDLYNGRTVKVNLEKEVLCEQCKGYVYILVGHRDIK